MIDNNSLSIFNFENTQIRCLGTSTDPWWIAIDVCRALEINSPSSAYARLEEDERGIGLTDDGNTLVTINESGLYNLIFRSRKEVANKFRKWVTGEVLPEIRRTGQYNASKNPNHIPDRIAIATNKLKDCGINQVQAQLYEFDQLAKYDKPYSSIWLDAKKELETITIQSDRLASPQELGKKYAEVKQLTKPLSAIKINQMLEGLGLQYKKSRISTKSKKEKYDWTLTLEGEEYGAYLMTTARNSSGTVQPLRWHPDKTIEYLIKNELNNTLFNDTSPN